MTCSADFCSICPQVSYQSPYRRSFALGEGTWPLFCYLQARHRRFLYVYCAFVRGVSSHTTTSPRHAPLSQPALKLSVYATISLSEVALLQLALLPSSSRGPCQGLASPTAPSSLCSTSDCDLLDDDVCSHVGFYSFCACHRPHHGDVYPAASQTPLQNCHVDGASSCACTFLHCCRCSTNAAAGACPSLTWTWISCDSYAYLFSSCVSLRFLTDQFRAIFASARAGY